MTRFETPRVAVVGAGEVGRGWAALAVAAGWPVTIYDADGEKLSPAADAIADRVVRLVRLHRAQASVAEDALNVMRVGRSLLNAVSDADWIIEAVPEEIAVKQKALQLCEQVARRAAIITSSSAGLGPTLLSARLDHPERFIVTHPIEPVDLVPLVEVVPGPKTDPEAIEDIRFWLSMMGRAPVVFKKEVAGNLAQRLRAAVWRECIQLALDGVLDVEDIDRAVSVGPSLAWAATGPHLDHQLGGGQLGVDIVLPKMLGEYEVIWKSLADWKSLPTEEQNRLVKLLDKAYAPHLTELRDARDLRMVRLLEALRE
jgi:3-hydroxypropionate dehydrogenase (NADP+)